MQFFQTFNKLIDQLLSRPDIDSKTLIHKKTTWIWTVSAAFGVLIMTLFSWAMGVWTLVWFGVVLLFFYAAVIPLLGYVKDFERLSFYFLLLVIFITFLTILKLGGITHSMGLVFVGLACAMASMLSTKIKRAIVTFSFYAATIIAAGLLQPLLTVTPEVTPFKNLLFHVVNLLWLTGSSLNFIATFMRHRSELEEAKSEYLRELHEVKTRLYTNLTHEFRTPLTIILGIAGQMRETEAERFSGELDLIIRNGYGLLNLVNQMLDLQKIEAGLMSIQSRQSDIVPFLAYVVHSFSSLTDTKNIRLRFAPGVNSLVMDYDDEKLQNILSNLLSNAIKFTPAGGEVIVSGDASGSTLVLTVQDTGIGIPEKQLPYIFDHFYQVKDSAANNAGGSGIGLALCKELVKLMNGEISVKSNVGEGSVFTIRLPITRQAPLQKQLTEIFEKPAGVKIPAPIRSTGPGAAISGEDKLPLLLLVEDNPDMVHYLRTCLHNDYRLEKASDGKMGLKKALELIPDIIISDVMMPEMDGIELCSKIKNDFRTSHIPVLLLTAKADMPSKIEGLKSGADAYLSKPFFKEELLVRLQNLTKLRQKLQQRYASPEAPLPSNDRAVQMEDVFMQQVRSIVESHLGDENFGVPQLCYELAMSRAQLYRKFQALTSLPIGRFIRTLRLRKAKELLESATCNVTEAAMEAGFRNLSHFSVAFKDEFGISPGEIQH